MKNDIDKIICELPTGEVVTFDDASSVEVLQFKKTPKDYFEESVVAIRFTAFGREYEIKGIPSPLPPKTSEEAPFNEYSIVPGATDPNDTAFERPISELEWFTPEQQLPDMLDYFVVVKLNDGRELQARYNELMDVWFYDTEKLFNVRICRPDKVVEWRYLNAQEKA